MTDTNTVPRHERRWVKKAVYIYVTIFLVVGALAGGFVWGRFGSQPFAGMVNYYQNSLPMEELPTVLSSDLMKLVWSQIKHDYVHQEEIDAKKLYYGSISGFVSGLGDPHTSFFDPETAKEFNENIDGEFQGIGAEIGIKDSHLTIVAPMPGSPAEKAGLMAGDWVLTIDGFDTTDMPLDKAVKMIRGPKGTTVTLLIVHDKSDEPIEVKINRDVITLEVLRTTFRDDGLVYIQLASFNADSGDKIDEAIRSMKGKNVKGIIFDLRNNPGGLLTMANYITSKWVKKGSPTVIEKFGDGRRVVYKAEGDASWLGIPTVVLINKGSASASEILAGALKDYDAATLVGETSFGKGSVQELRPLPDGSALKLTIAEWLTPKETFINKIGVEPDVKVEMTWEDVKAKKDPQLDKAVEILLGKQ